jgi:hypothetical protein
VPITTQNGYSPAVTRNNLISDGQFRYSNNNCRFKRDDANNRRNNLIKRHLIKVDYDCVIEEWFAFFNASFVKLLLQKRKKLRVAGTL